MAVKNIVELFVLDGSDFVNGVYQNLLMREPDEHGLMYYLGRLSQGYTKADVIAQVAQSPECRPLDEIAGLKKLTLDARRAKKWFRGWFTHPSRMEGAAYICMNKYLASLQETLKFLTNEHVQKMDSLVQQVAQVQFISPEHGQIQDKPQRLSSEAVKQAFIDILGRDPESTETISHHARLESYQALSDHLISSIEFQSRLVPLSEYARQIFQRQIQMTKE